MCYKKKKGKMEKEVSELTYLMTNNCDPTEKLDRYRWLISFPMQGCDLQFAPIMYPRRCVHSDMLLCCIVATDCRFSQCRPNHMQLSDQGAKNKMQESRIAIFPLVCKQYNFHDGQPPPNFLCQLFCKKFAVSKGPSRGTFLLYPKQYTHSQTFSSLRVPRIYFLADCGLYRVPISAMSYDYHMIV